ncbi:hypothetical protein [Rhodopirellula bahusiensis]|uniref:hypothetical protein n=1 Tax=Rhodopirellula bahusiensis TaxID=2014065 RepID=UPI0032659DF8
MTLLLGGEVVASSIIAGNRSQDRTLDSPSVSRGIHRRLPLPIANSITDMQISSEVRGKHGEGSNAFGVPSLQKNCRLTEYTAHLDRFRTYNLDAQISQRSH